MATVGCSHLHSYKRSSKNKETFKWIHAVFVVGATSKCKKTRICNAYCRVCKERGPLLHACLECVFFGCHKHIRDHQKNQKHTLVMDLTYGQIHCYQCNDYIYDSDIDSVMRDNKVHGSTFRKRLFESTSWDPLPEEKELLAKKSKKISITPESTIGLRGLYNLGVTCFMNCVIQVFMHIPLLRDYFLSGRLKCKCEGKLGACLVCEFSNLFQEFYTGASNPLAPSQLLYLTRINIKILSLNEQHDAHEFFIATLELLHRQFAETVLPSKAASYHNSNRCSCIIDQIFVGRQQSVVVCQKCNNISRTVENFSDFSLDVTIPHPEGKTLTLIDCLNHYTRIEHLGENAKIMCLNCESDQLRTRQFTIDTLPIVVCFSLKRFWQCETIKKKIETVVTFPETLDLSPYMCKSKKESPFPVDNRYSLFGVIDHSGNINEGHYISFVRQQNDFWYECADPIITRTSLKKVLKAEAYLLFYHRHVLNYD